MSCFVLVHIFHIEYLDLNEDINGEFYCFAMLFFIVEVLFSYCILSLSLSLSLCLSLSLSLLLMVHCNIYSYHSMPGGAWYHVVSEDDVLSTLTALNFMAFRSPNHL